MQEFVAHEKFQQMLHKKWGQRDRTAAGRGVKGYNIFWHGIATTSFLKICLFNKKGYLAFS